MRIIQLVFKIFLSLVFGLSLALAWFQFDERFIALANRNTEKVFEQQLNCQFNGRVKRLNLFYLNIDFEDVRVVPLDAHKNWSWNTEHMTMRLSLLEYLYYGAFGLHVNLAGLRAFSGIKKGMPTVYGHLSDLFAGANFGVPIVFQSVAIVDGKLLVQDEQEKIKFVCCWNNNADKAGKDFKTKFYVSDTSLTIKDKKVFEDFRGQITFDSMHCNRFIRVSIDTMVSFSQLPDEQKDCYFMGSWNKNVGSFVLYNPDRTFSFVPITLASYKDSLIVNAEGVVLAEYIKRLYAPEIEQTVNGMCTVKISGDLYSSLYGNICVQNFGYQKYTIDELSSDFIYTKDLWRGTVAGKKSASCIAGLWHWSNKQEQGAIRLMNKTVLPFWAKDYWECTAGKTAIQGLFKKDGTGKLFYTTILENKKTDHQINSSGTIISKKDVLEISGLVGDASYQSTLLKDPLWIKELIYKDSSKKKLFSLSTTKKNQYVIIADCSSAQMLARDLLGWDITGYGTFKSLVTFDYPKMRGNLSFKNGAIRPVGMYNFISDITTDFSGDLKTKTAALQDTSITLHQGAITSSKTSCFWNPDGSLLALHCPIQFHNCFLNLKKSLYAICTGASVLQLGSGVQQRLDGFIVLDKSQFKENIFALQTQQNALQALPVQDMFTEMQINFGVSTQTPLLVSTSHLQTQAVLDCLITGCLRGPEVQGSLQLRGGSFVFPAHTLDISQGKITFLPAYADDPHLELTAQARIKKYLVKLTIGGTIKDPEVFLQSTPMLSEEQIVMLLFTGSEHESFNIMVPSLVMRNIETVLFGPSKTLTQAPASFASWLKPLEKVTFIPRFNDQSGRGGFKGVLEVEVSKRLRAVLEKDFSLAEDTAAEIEYLASDDVSFKINRDERGDIGAEMEMRFKF
jgi:hypothetical protein